MHSYNASENSILEINSNKPLSQSEYKRKQFLHLRVDLQL